LHKSMVDFIYFISQFFKRHINKAYNSSNGPIFVKTNISNKILPLRQLICVLDYIIGM
jgi:hypothetical protein